jgi:hypothetical protein
MKKRVFFLPAALALVCAASIWNWWSFRKPEIAVPEPVIDLGVLDHGQAQTKAAFEIINKGKLPLLITGITASCPCLEPELNRSELPGGETATLTITVSPPSRAGKWQDRLLVFSNDPDHPVTVLTVTALIKFGWTVVPDRVYVSDVSEDRPQEVELTILGPTNDSLFRVLDISSGTHSVDLCDIHDSGQVTENNRKIWKAGLVVRSRGLQSWKDQLMITTTDASVPSIGLPVSVQEFKEIAVVPTMVSLSRAADAGPTSAIVQILSNRPSLFLECARLRTPEWITVRQIPGEQGVANRIEFEVRLAEPFNTGMSRGEIKVFLRNRAQPINIPVVLF